MGILHTFQAANSHSCPPHPCGKLANYWLTKNCLEEVHPKLASSSAPLAKYIELQPARSLLNDQWTSLLMFYLDHGSFYLYLLILHVCSGMAPETTSLMRNATGVINTLHVYLYGNLTCLCLRKNWTKDRGWGGVSDAIFSLLKIEILP